MTNLFSRANSIGLGCVQQWLPDGRREGDEWKALNPTRADGSIGSFSVNLATGAWADFATDDTGGDAVSLYAYLNYSACESAARARGYKNVSGGIQAEAARAILEKHDPGYFPSAEDDFQPVVAVKAEAPDVWAGYAIMQKGMDEPPVLDTSWHQRQWGQEIARWDFRNAKGAIVMRVVRFKKDGEKKSDRPFTLWENGEKTKWRCKALDCDYPLWNLPEILSRVNDPILLTEGQKAAAVARDVMKGYVCTGWYQGASSVNRTDMKPLCGRHVYFWPDADNAGRSVIKRIKNDADEIGFDLHLVYAPGGVKKGWDIADAIADGMMVEEIEALIKQSDVPACRPAVEAQPFVDDIAKKWPAASGALDDIQDAWRVAQFLGDDFRWCEIRNAWYFYDCGVWRRDDEELRIQRETKLAVLAFEKDAVERGDKNGVAHYRSIAKNINRVKRILESMKSECNVYVGTFDQHDNLVNCQNGTLNLDTFDFTPFEKNEYHTKQIQALYDPNAAVPEMWTQFIMDIFRGDEDVIRYVQKILGYSLGGGSGEQEFYIFWGDGNNGKSQLIKCFSLLADSYAHNMGADKIMQSKWVNNDTYLAQLKNIRALFCSERATSRTLDSDLIKLLTGGEPLTVAQKYERPESFEISAKVFLITNHKPGIRDQTEGIWRRIRLIPFNYEVPAEKRIIDYGNVLFKSGPSGILNWLLEGYRLYRIDGLKAPEIVRAGDVEYRSEEDVLLQFTTEQCEKINEGKITLEEFYQRFKMFAEDSNCHWSKKRLSKELKTRKINIEHGRIGAIVCGYSWRNARPGELALDRSEEVLKEVGLTD